MKSNLYSYKDLIENTGLCYSTILTYLCRSEFSHIEKITKNKIAYFKGFTLEDFRRLKNLKRRK